MLTQELCTPLYYHVVCLLKNYFLYSPTIPTHTLCTIVFTITKQHINVEPLQILDFRWSYPLPLIKLVTLSYLLTTLNLNIGFIFELSQLVLCLRLQFLRQIRDSSKCLHFRQCWYIHRWLRRYSQIIRNRNQYFHQVFVKFFWRDSPSSLRPSMMIQIPPQSQIPNDNLLFQRRTSHCLTSQS